MNKQTNFTKFISKNIRYFDLNDVALIENVLQALNKDYGENEFYADYLNDYFDNYALDISIVRRLLESENGYIDTDMIKGVNNGENNN